MRNYEKRVYLANGVVVAEIVIPKSLSNPLNNEKFDDEIRLVSQALNYYYYLKNKSTRLEDLKQLSHLRDAYELYQDGEVDHFVNAMEQYRLEEKENDDNAL